MLYRVSGELTDSKRFVARIEAPSPIAAVGQARGAFQEAGVAETDVAVIRVKAVKDGKSLHISDKAAKPRTPKKAPAAAAAAPKK